MTERLTFNYGTGRETVHGRASGDGLPAPAEGSRAAAVSLDDHGSDWAWRGLITFTFVLFFRPQDHLPFLEPLHLAEVTALLALGAMLGQRMRRNLPLFPVTPELFGVVALGMLMLATVPFSVWMGGAVSTFTDVYLKIIAVFVLMMHVLTSRQRIERMTWVILLACGYLGGRAVLDYARGVNLVEGGRVQGSIGGIFRNPNDLALNLVSYLPLAIFAVISPATPAKRLGGGLIALLMMGAVVCTQSRSGTIGLGMVLLITGAYALRRRPSLVAGTALAIMFMLPLMPSSYWARMASITDDQLDTTGSKEARQTLMKEAWQTFLDHPLTGVGAGQFRNYNPEDREQKWHEAHNAVLQLASELGVFGPAILFFLIYRGLGATRRARALLTQAIAEGRIAPADPAVKWMDAHLAAMAAGIIGWFFCALFASVAYNWTFYYLLALAVAPRELLLARTAPVGRRKRAFAVHAAEGVRA